MAEMDRHDVFKQRFSQAKRGRTNKDISIALSINAGTITSWLTHRSFPRADTFLDLANLLGCDPQWLGGGDGLEAIRYDSGITADEEISQAVEKLNTVLSRLVRANPRLLIVATNQIKVLVEASERWEQEDKWNTK